MCVSISMIAMFAALYLRSMYKRLEFGCVLDLIGAGDDDL